MCESVVRIAVPWKVLRRHQHLRHRVGVRTINERSHVSRHFRCLLTIGTYIDDRIIGIIVDVRHRSKDPVDPHRPRSRAPSARPSIPSRRPDCAAAAYAMLCGNLVVLATRIDAPRSKSEAMISGSGDSLCI